MAEGFIFNYDKCVGCEACNAACMVENNWAINPRTIFIYNAGALPGLTVINLSLACNHCEKAVCLEGCPAGAYYREPVTGAVVIDETKCIGCRYCQWNCPYDAPKYDQVKRVTGKCNLCYPRLKDGLMPACSIACPTGALEYGELTVNFSHNQLSWFPDKNLNPAIRFTGNQNNKPLRIVPSGIFKENLMQLPDNVDYKIEEWSLVAFSWLITLSVAIIISSLINGSFPGKALSVSVLLLAGLISLFHLGNMPEAYRAVTNLRSSPLSREISILVLYSLISVATIILQIPALLLISPVVGLILLLVVDIVYLYADNRKGVILHSGQTFITALLISSFFTGIILPFVFMGLIKLALSFRTLINDSKETFLFGIRYLRIALLVISAVSFVSGIAYPGTAVFVLFLAGELLDRIIFYIDFKPLNISRLIDKNIIRANNEKR